MQNTDPVPQTPLTQQTYNSLVAEKKRLLALREEVKIRLNIAREMGDLSENGAYTYAKFEISSINRQLREIQYQLDTSVITNIKSTYTKVEFGCVVTLKIGTTTNEYTVVGTFEADPVQKKISLDGPLGKVIANKKVGFTTEFETPRGLVALEIVEIK